MVFHIYYICSEETDAKIPWVQEYFGCLLVLLLPALSKLSLVRMWEEEETWSVTRGQRIRKVLKGCVEEGGKETILSRIKHYALVHLNQLVSH